MSDKKQKSVQSISQKFASKTQSNLVVTSIAPSLFEPLVDNPTLGIATIP